VFYRLDDGEDIIPETCTPIGVTVIPASHDVYGTGECGVMSLMEMDWSRSDTGSLSNTAICWGYNSLNISSLEDMDTVCYVGSIGTINETVQGTTPTAMLPSDKFSELANPYDTDTSYSSNNRGTYIPSPYNDDESRNPAYYQTSSPSSTSNAMSDFDGAGNTQIIINLATSQPDWKTATTITNSYLSGYYPAACCCWRFHTDGTSQGDWHLPACGELGYIMPKFNAINASIAALIDAYGNSVGVQLFNS